MQRKFKIGLSIVALMFGLYSVNHIGQNNHAKMAKTDVLVTVVPVVQTNVAVPLKTIGSVVAYSNIAVQSLVDGQLLEVGFKEGDFVKKGQMLFKIDPRPYEAAVAEASGNLASDQAKLDNAKLQLERNQPLMKKGYIDEVDFQQLKANVNALAANVTSDKAAIDAANIQLEHSTILSPIDGRTGSLQVDPGNIIKSASGTTLVTITKINPIYVSFSVSQNYLSDISTQQMKAPVAVSASVNGHVESGEISFIDNMIDESTDSIQLKAIFPNQDLALWPGQYVAVSLPAIHLSNALLVPSSAVLIGQSGAFVYVLNVNSTVSVRAVKIGPLVGNNTVIMSGLKVGEKVVTDGQLRLQDGMSVKVGAVPMKKTKSGS